MSIFLALITDILFHQPQQTIFRIIGNTSPSDPIDHLENLFPIMFDCRADPKNVEKVTLSAGTTPAPRRMCPRHLVQPVRCVVSPMHNFVMY